MISRVGIVSTVLIIGSVFVGLLIAPSFLKSKKEAVQFAERLIDEGHTEEGLAEMRRLASDGNADAMCFLAGGYYFGMYGLPEDHKIGFEWFLKSAKGGSLLGQYFVGTLYASGMGTPKDSAQAVHWWRKAAQAGLPSAQLSLSTAYRSGMGNLNKDLGEAIKWCRTAAESGYADAQVELAIFYGVGNGVPEDKVESEKWLRAAAEQGNVMGMQLLGVSKAGSKEYEESVKWLTKGVEQGDGGSEFWLGTLYEKGAGVEQSSAKADELYRRAAAKGVQRAVDKLATRESPKPLNLRRESWFSR